MFREVILSDVNARHMGGALLLTEENYRLYKLTEELNDGVLFSARLDWDMDTLSDGRPYCSRCGHHTYIKNVAATFGWRDDPRDSFQRVTLSAEDAFSDC